MTHTRHDKCAGSDACFEWGYGAGYRDGLAVSQSTAELAKHDADLLAPIRALDESQLRNLGHIMEVAQSHERFRGSGKDPRNVAAQAAIDWLTCLLASTDPAQFRFEPPPYRAVIDTPTPLVVPDKCPTPGCGGDPRYGAPGRGHHEACRYPIDTPAQADAGGES